MTEMGCRSLKAFSKMGYENCNNLHLPKASGRRKPPVDSPFRAPMRSRLAAPTGHLRVPLAWMLAAKLSHSHRRAGGVSLPLSFQIEPRHGTGWPRQRDTDVSRS